MNFILLENILIHRFFGQPRPAKPLFYPAVHYLKLSGKSSVNDPFAYDETFNVMFISSTVNELHQFHAPKSIFHLWTLYPKWQIAVPHWCPKTNSHSMVFSRSQIAGLLKKHSRFIHRIRRLSVPEQDFSKPPIPLKRPFSQSPTFYNLIYIHIT